MFSQFYRVYCKYHYLEGHEFKTPEDELREFLGKMMNDWKWPEQYAEDESDWDDKDECECANIWNIHCNSRNIDNFFKF